MIDRKITYRLIGVGIIALSAAIVLPLVLDGERPPELDIEVQVTEPPAFSIVEIATVQPKEELETSSIEKAQSSKSAQEISLLPAIQDESKVTETKKTVSLEANVSSKTSSEKVADRWTVQIATFKSRTNATRLVDKLKADNYSAYSVTTKTLYKVFVGPEFKRDVSERVRDDIKKKFNLSGIVIKFSVN